jgi:hypothetical protein
MSWSPPNYQSNLFNVIDGIDQGCPLLLLGFIFYNSDVLRVADLNPRQGELSLGFLDDIVLVARGKTYAESNEKLKHMMEKREGALEWSEQHNAKFEFELEKTTLICLSSKRITDPNNHSKTIPSPRLLITIRNHTI